MKIVQRDEDEGGYTVLNAQGQRAAGPYRERADAEAYAAIVMNALQSLMRPHAPRYRRPNG